MAAEQGVTGIVELLLDRGADPDIPGTSIISYISGCGARGL